MTAMWRFCASGLLLVLSFLNDPAAADGRVQIFGVDVHVESLESPCVADSPPYEVRTKVGSFQPSVSVGEILSELARLTSARGGNTLYAVRVLTAAPLEGAEVSGLAAHCADGPSKAGSLPLPFSPSLIRTIAESTEAEVFGLSQSSPTDFYVFGEKALAGRASGQNFIDLRKFILDPETYEDSRLLPSCPFKASDAVHFRFESADAWWVYSARCGTAIVVADTTALRTKTVAVRRGKQDDFQKLKLAIIGGTK
jgi:hypothetical protein